MHIHVLCIAFFSGQLVICWGNEILTTVKYIHETGTTYLVFKCYSLLKQIHWSICCVQYCLCTRTYQMCYVYSMKTTFTYSNRTVIDKFLSYVLFERRIAPLMQFLLEWSCIFLLKCSNLGILFAAYHLLQVLSTAG